MSGFNRWGAGWWGVRMLRTWLSPGTDLVESELAAARWRGEREARVRRLREYAAKPPRDRMLGRLGSEMRAALERPGKPAVPLVLELSSAEMEQFQQHGAMAVPEGIVWPA